MLLHKLLAIAILLTLFFVSDKFHYPFIFPKSILFMVIVIPMAFLLIYEKVIKKI